ncbi:FUSC family protein [Acidisphaera sp. S103]|uniref:FUSC family protein n=1 Tax=Acidisphaera sp. S103 TaxID=1747223 RepID=UPI00131C9CEA|nr:FUSC family protein [Acidisphaera sp. S103]
MSRWPGISDWIYSLKTFASAIAALYIAMAIGLDRPYWAMATVYIVSQPLTGAMRSKAIYRLIGTAIGASATIALVPNLVDAPELLTTALAVWVGGCLYIALLDRTPRSYVFMLAGYTAALIGFPAVTTPDAIWSIALARVEEIWLGIICTTVIGTVVFPRELGPALSMRILIWAGNAFNWTEDVLAGRPDLDKRQAHIQLAADVVELRLLGSHLAYDTSRYQTATRWVTELQKRMVLLLPLLSSINDRLGALRAEGGMTPGLTRLLADMGVWVRAVQPPPPRSEADRMRASIARCQAETDPRAGWTDIMRGSVLQRLGQLVDLRQDMRDLRQHVEQGGGALAHPLAVHTHAPDRQHHDRGLALLSGLAAVITVMLVCAFWIGTGWAAGGNMAALAAAACCLFAALDDPTPALKGMLLSVVIAAVAVGIGLFAILPLVHDFEMLTLVLAAFFVPVGLLIAMPATQLLGTPLGFLTATLLSLESAYAADFVTYADGSIAAILGVAGAAVVTALMRSVGAEWSARRLLRANWRDLAAIPNHREPHQRGALSALLIDRLGLLVPRLAAIGTDNELAAADVLADLRIGINMIDLQHDRDGLPLPLRAAVDDVVAGTARHFHDQVVAGRVRSPSPALLSDIDRALDAAVAMAGAGDLLLQLVGIRRGLFADAEPFHPTPPPGGLAREAA